MPLPAWVLTAMMHPEIQRVGLSALKKAGAKVTNRFGGVPAISDTQPNVAESDIVALRDTLESLPTRGELAEAIAAIDSQNEQRYLSLRRLLIYGLAAQTAILGGLIYFK